MTKLLSVLGGTATPIPPIWFMRQAGRYLPEYRALREKAGSFLDLCFNPEFAAEVTLQPARRFDLDAAILFSDILVVPHALGQTLSFVEGEGPRLQPPVSVADIEAFRRRDVVGALSPIFETMRRVRAELPPEKALLGFAGAPWTVATYMLAGGASADPAALRARYYDDPGFVDSLIEVLVDATADYLIAQVDAGADALQLFDSWAGGLPPDLLTRVSLAPSRAVATRVKAARPGTAIIFFPKGVGLALSDYAELPECDCISIDWTVPPDYARRQLSPNAVVQGGLDPLLVVAGGAAMLGAAARLLRAFEGAPYVFNLGHGCVPETPPENVAELVRFVRSEVWRSADA